MSLMYRVVDQEPAARIVKRDVLWQDEARTAGAAGYDAARVLDMYGTDESVDRHNTKIRVDGWNFDDYRKNPTFLWSHNMDPAVPTMPIGRIIGISREEYARADGATNKRLLFQIEFPTRGTYPFADLACDMYKQGMLKASSVGFRNLKMRRLSADDDRDEMEKEGYDLKAGFAAELTHNSLMELSAVPVGSNPNALVKSLRGIVPSDVKGLLDHNDEVEGEIDDAWLAQRLEALREALAPEPVTKKDAPVFPSPVGEAKPAVAPVIKDPSQHLPQADAKPDGSNVDGDVPVKSRVGSNAADAIRFGEYHDKKAAKYLESTTKHGADTIKGINRATEMDAHNQLASLHKQHAGLLKQAEDAEAKKLTMTGEQVTSYRKAADAKGMEVDAAEKKLTRAQGQFGRTKNVGEPHPELSAAEIEAKRLHRGEDINHDEDSHDELQQHYEHGAQFHGDQQKHHQQESDRKTAEAGKHAIMAKAAVAAGADREEVAKHVDAAQKAKLAAAHHDGKALEHEVEKKRHAGNATDHEDDHEEEKLAPTNVEREIEAYFKIPTIDKQLEQMFAAIKAIPDQIKAFSGAAAGGALAAPKPAVPAPSSMDLIFAENLESLERMSTLFPKRSK